MKDYRSLVVVITGASSGIGRATALAFAEKGSTVVLAARREEALAMLAQECEQRGGKALVVPTDVSREEAVQALALKTYDTYGRIDIWINNAAVSLFGIFDETPLEDIQKVIQTNLFGYIYGAHAVLPYFKRAGRGTLINVSSMVGMTAQPYTAAYTTSKFGIRGLSLGLAQELAEEKQIHVCTVYPSVIDTPIFQQAGNYLGKAVKAPDPVIPAKEVAKTIVQLVASPKHEVVVGHTGKLSRMARLIAPELFDKKFRKTIAQKHFKDQPQETTQGNLYEPNPTWTSVSGGWPTAKVKDIPVSGKAILFGTLALSGFMIGRFVLKR